MANRSESLSLPPAVKRAAGAFRITGWVSFWVQLVLAIVSGIVLLFAAGGLGAASTVQTPPVPGGAPAGDFTRPETGIGLFLAVLGLLVLFAGAFWAFRYTRISRRLRLPDAQARPKRGDVLTALRFGLVINLVGMLLTILGAQAIVGSLVGKSFSQGFTIFTGNALRFITPLDIFLVQANINTIMAHFIGLIASLVLLRILNRQ